MVPCEFAGSGLYNDKAWRCCICIHWGKWRHFRPKPTTAREDQFRYDRILKEWNDLFDKIRMETEAIPAIKGRCFHELFSKSHFLSLLAGLGEIPGDALLCTVDVVDLYPSIPHDEGLEAMRHALNSRQNPGVSTGSLVNLVRFVLENNVFEFDVYL